jgi:hypothetical protein
MRRKVYSIFDKAALAYLQPFFLQTDGEAKRSFIDAVKNHDNFRDYPNDFVLFRLGQFDDGSGQFIQDESCPEQLMTAVDALRLINGVNEEEEQ